MVFDLFILFGFSGYYFQEFSSPKVLLCCFCATFTGRASVRVFMRLFRDFYGACSWGSLININETNKLSEYYRNMIKSCVTRQYPRSVF